MLKIQIPNYINREVSLKVYRVYYALFFLSFLFSVSNYTILEIFRLISSQIDESFKVLPEIILWLLTIFIVLWEGQINLNQKQWNIIKTLFVFIILSAISIMSFNLVFSLRLLFIFFIGLIITNRLQHGVIFIFVRFVFYLSAISLVIYFGSIIFPGINLLIQNIGFTDGGGNYSILIYNIKTRALERNCGFAYEPGPFGLANALALLFELAYSKHRIKTHYFVYLLSIFTSQSSTAGLALIIIIFWNIREKYKYSKTLILIIPIVIMIIVYFFTTTSFMQEKIFDDYEKSLNYEQIISNSKESENYIGTYRFAMLWIALPDLLEKPFFGFSHNPNLSHRDSNNIMIRGTGPIGFLGKYGIFPVIFLSFIFYKSLKVLSNYFSSDINYVLGVVTFFVLFSFITFFESILFAIFFVQYTVHE